MRSVWVVVDIDGGWDNIVGIFSQEELEYDQLRELFPIDDEYSIRSLSVYSDLEMFS